MPTKELLFYKQPFRKTDSWIYDANENFVCQFEPKYDTKGEFAPGEIELQKEVLESLNSKNQNPVKGLELTVNDYGEILNYEEPFITIRGWGNLTGIGGHNLPAKKAAKIQDDFRDWIIYKLTTIQE